MKLAITVWNGRVAPVFDVAERCLVVSLKSPDGENTPSQCMTIPQDTIEKKIDFFLGEGISLIICGAISRGYEELLVASGIEVISFIAGPVDSVVDAWHQDKLVRTEFSMPGCGCPRRRCGRHRRYQHPDLRLSNTKE